jgi:hypothetical protein
MRSTALPLLAFAGLALAACGGDEPPETQAPPPASAGAEGARRGAAGPPRGGGRGGMAMHELCEMVQAGADVETEELEDGVALTFTTTDPAQLEELRARVRAMAQRHRERASAGPPPGRGRGPGPRAPSVEASAVDVEDGARLELRATDPDDVDALRERTRRRAAHMRECPMGMERRAAAGRPPPRTPAP